MKILQITNSLANGGAEKFVVKLSNELSKENEIILCSVKPVAEWMIPPKLIQTNVRTIILGCNKKYSFSLFYRFYTLIRDIKPDVVHIHSSILVFYLYFISFFFPEILFVQTIHSTLTPGYKKLFQFLHHVRFLNRTFVNVCISHEILNEFQAAFKKLNFVEIENGIAPITATPKFAQVKEELDQLKRSARTKVLLAVGNYSDFKNFKMLVEIFSELEIQNNDVILLIIGGGEFADHKNFEEIEKSKSRNAHQVGFKDNVADYLLCADALVISSLKEGLPLIALEALSLGLPIISTPAGGMKDIVTHGKNGFLSDDFSKQALQKKINEFLSSDEETIHNMQIANRKSFAQGYTIHKCARNYLDLYHSSSIRRPVTLSAWFTMLPPLSLLA